MAARAPIRKTTRATTPVRSIEEIRVLEERPYDTLVAARNLFELIEAPALLHRDRPALSVVPAARPDEEVVTLSHGDLLREVTRAANLFHSLAGTTGPVVVAFLCPTLPAVPVALLGAQIAGVASSINYLLSVDAIVDLLLVQRATILVVPSAYMDGAIWEKASAIIDRVGSIDTVLVLGGKGDSRRKILGYESALAGYQGDALDFTPSGRSSVCALFHTGGTTGRPKLVRLTHGNQIHAAWAFAQLHGLDEQDVAINGFPLFHVGGTITAGLSIIAAGGHVVMPAPYSLRSPEAIRNYWKFAARFRATIVSGVPTSIAALTDVPIGACDLSAVRMALTGGAVLPKAVGNRFRERTGIRIFETYGMTETAAFIGANPGRGTPLEGSVGFRAPFSQIRIVPLEDNSGADRPPLSPGLVLAKGPQVFPGYLDPRHNAGMLTADGWLVTGDIGYLTEDQRLVLTGREKDLIVRSGHNIDPAAIEDVANDFPGVKISAAVGMPDAYAGELPILFVVPATGHTLDLVALKQHVEDGVMEPPAKPKRIVAIDELPVTAVGKVFKPALRDLAVKEKARLEIDRIFGDGVPARIDIERDEKLQTCVSILVWSPRQDLVEKLSDALSSLPQRYSVKSTPAEPIANSIVFETMGAVAFLTLNRPEALNALSKDLMKSLDLALDRIAADASVRAVVITGSGRAFSAGGDLKEFGGQLEDDPASLLETLAFNQGVLAKLERLPMPVIAAVNGMAVAGGLEIVLCCDIVIAAEGCLIGDGHARYAVLPAGGATVRLARKLPPNRAMQLFFTADLVTAEELCSWGLINEILPRDRLLGRARELADQIASRSPEVLKRIKRLVNQNRERADNDGYNAEIQGFAEHIHGRDFAEGLRAFREKRPPNY